MQDLTDVKMFLTSLLEPIVYKAVKAATNQQVTAIALPPADELLTPEETAQLLKVSKVTVWDWSKRGILNKLTIGNQVRYLRSEVLAAPLPSRTGGRQIV